MALNFQNKKEIVTEINKVAKRAVSAVIADSCGINADKMTELRKAARLSDVYVRIVRNTLLKRAVECTNFECLRDMFVGPTLIAYSMKYPSAAARLFKNFSKVNTSFKIKAAAFEGRLIQASQIESLASLPTHEEALVRLIILMKEISSWRLVRILAAIRDIKSKEIS